MEELKREMVGLKISFLITRSDTIGGAHIHVLDLASRAQSAGNTVEVLVGGNGPFAALLRDKGLKVVNLRYLVRPIRPHLDALAILECWRALKRFGPDLVHAHSTKAGLVGRLAARFAGLPVVFTAHGWAFTEGVAEQARRIAVFLERHAAGLSDAIICVSDYDRRLALGLGVGNPSLLRCIHNGVSEVAPALRCSGSLGAVVRIVSVARLDVPKNHALLLEALATIKGMPWVLELIGDGPLTGRTKQMARDLGLADRVEFSGLCTDIPDRLARADMFALVSDWESLPLSILEAMRAGLPVLASDVGGVAESLPDGVTGFLVPKGDKAVLAERLRRLVGNSALRQQMGHAGRLLYERKFAFETMYRSTCKVYQDVLKRETEK